MSMAHAYVPPTVPISDVPDGDNVKNVYVSHAISAIFVTRNFNRPVHNNIIYYIEYKNGAGERVIYYMDADDDDDDYNNTGSMCNGFTTAGRKVFFFCFDHRDFYDCTWSSSADKLYLSSPSIVENNLYFISYKTRIISIDQTNLYWFCFFIFIYNTIDSIFK